MIGTHLPDSLGRFGEFGGRYVPETVMAALDELEAAVNEAFADPGAAPRPARRAGPRFIGRPTPVYLAERLSADVGGAQIWLKREDLNHTGAHKINNAVGQALLAQRLGKKRIVAETGAGQHGVACCHHLRSLRARRGRLHGRRGHPPAATQRGVRMGMLGAELVSVTAGAGTLKDAMNEAIRDWIATVETTHYMIGSAAGPHPYPYLVRELQAVIGQEARARTARPHRPPARRRRRLRRRRGERDRPVPPVPRRRRAHRRGRGGRRRRGAARASLGSGRVFDPARLAVLRARRGRARPGEGDALHLGRPRLPRRRPRACRT